MSESSQHEYAEYFVNSMRENLASYWTGVSTAISESQTLLSKMEEISAAEYENYGRKMSSIAADYANGLTFLAEGGGSAMERQVFTEMSDSILEAIDNIREGGSESYAKYGESILQSAEAARLARLANLGGTVVDFAELTAEALNAHRSGDWNKFGGIVAGIGTATAAGEFGAILVGALGGLLGVTGSPVVVTTFIVAGAFAALGGYAGQPTYDKISELVNTLFEQSVNRPGIRGGHLV